MPPNAFKDGPWDGPYILIKMGYKMDYMYIDKDGLEMDLGWGFIYRV